MSYVRVAEEDALDEGKLMPVSLENGDVVCLARVDGVVYAMEDRCTHAEFPMSEGELGSDCQIECALHGAIFNLRDGSVLEGPAVEALPMYEVKIEDGAIWVAREG